MTREEAIEIINRENDPNDTKVWELFPEYREALDMAIKALSSQSDTSMEQALLLEVIDKCLPNPYDDTVSREVILSKIKEVCFSKEWTQFRIDNGSNGQRDYLINFIEKLPPVTQKSGKWLITPMSHMAYCSECDYLFKNIPANIVKQFKYCPNCGIKIESEDKV